MEISGRVLEQRLTQVQAAQQLGLGIRQVERLSQKLRVKGPSGLVSKQRGRTSNRSLPTELRERTLELVQSRYHDFGPTLAAEKLRIVCANTPQAKGRVECAHLTLQDRLVMELRLRGICTQEAANAYAPEFMADYNKRFAKEPLSNHDAHSSVRDDENVALIFSWQEDRLEFREGRGAFPLRAFEQDRRVTQGAIVSNKRLRAVLSKIQADQRSRDKEYLASQKVTLRKKQRIRTARAQADAPLGNP